MVDMESVNTVLFRSEQNAEIEAAIGCGKQDAQFPAVLLIGPENSGRQYSALSILRRENKRLIVLDADLIHNERNLFEQLLFSARKLLLRNGDDEVNEQASSHNLDAKLNCARAHDFAKHLDTLLKEAQLDETLFVVIRNADRLLTRVSAGTLRALLRINETLASATASDSNQKPTARRISETSNAQFNVARTRLCSLLIVSHASVSALSESSRTLLDDAFCVRFSAYSKDEVVRIVLERTGTVEQLLRECYHLGLLVFTDAKSANEADRRCAALAKRLSDVAVDTYVELVVQTFFSVCRNVNVLHRLVLAHFARFVEPALVEGGRLDVRHSWKRLEPLVKRSLRCAALQTLIYDANVFASLRLHVNADLHADASALPEFCAAAQHESALSVVDNFLLISAYLAAHNPAHTDAIYFAKERAKRSSKAARPSAQQYDAAPHARAFTLQRLISIFRFIFDAHSIVLPSVGDPTAAQELLELDECERENETERFADCVASHVQTLVQLGLLSPVNREQIDLASPRFRLLLDIDVVRSLSRSVHFDLAKYLPDSN